MNLYLVIDDSAGPFEGDIEAGDFSLVIDDSAVWGGATITVKITVWDGATAKTVSEDVDALTATPAYVINGSLPSGKVSVTVSGATGTTNIPIYLRPR